MSERERNKFMVAVGTVLAVAVALCGLVILVAATIALVSALLSA